MNGELLLKVTLMIVLIGMLSTVPNVKTVEISGTIYIRVDGSIDPPTAPIQRNGYIYTLTDNITIPPRTNPGVLLRIERDNIVLDGAGFTVRNTAPTPRSHDCVTPIPIGVLLSGRHNVTIKNIKITTFYHGIKLSGSSNNSIVKNTITESRGRGILLSESSNNNVSDNDIKGERLLLVEHSSHNIFLENNITGNRASRRSWYPFLLDGSSHNTISGNNFTDSGLFVSGSYGNIVRDNFVNGKPLVYLEDASNCIVENAGQVILVNCNSIRVENLTFSNTNVCAELWKTNNTVIAKNNMTHNVFGVWLVHSSNNSIVENNITANSDCGIWLSGSSNNNIVGNNITANSNFGDMHLKQSSNNNSIYHNIFSSVHIHPSENLVNVWDDGYPSGGNYWSNYKGVDADGDGIGDTPYTIAENNIDNYPLTDFKQSMRNLLEEYNKLNSSYSELQNELSYIRNLMYIFIATTATLIVSALYLMRKHVREPL